ncbi:glutathione S-transferas-like protein [Halenospora varia]|nr:glutathione S-transferas-like protein [Halenospora varia]
MASTASANQPKVTLYWLEQSRSQRILWLLTELQVPYELKIFHRDPKTHFAPDELKRVHALGKSPIISVQPTDPTKKPVIVAESAYEMEGGRGGTGGGETDEWLRFRYFMNYAEGTLMSLLFTSLIASNIKNGPVPFFIRPITNTIAGKLHSGYLSPNFSTNFSFLEDQLKTSPEGGKYLCGPRLTGADILMSFPLLAAHEEGVITREQYPALVEYTERLGKEEGYLKAVEKIVEIEGKFELSPK